MDAECFMTDNAYVQRLIWQQMTNPQEVIISPNKNEIKDKEGIKNIIDVDACESAKKVAKRMSSDVVENDSFSVTPELKIKKFQSSALVKENGIRIPIRECLMQVSDPKRIDTLCYVSDRFIPKRAYEDWKIRFPMITDTETNIKKKENISSDNKDSFSYNYLLQNELFGTALENNNLRSQCDDRGGDILQSPRSLFHYRKRGEDIENVETISPYSLSAISTRSQKLLRSPRKATRKISRIPYKVLDAPELQDDFYLNLVDWSSQNVLAVGLGNSVYLWSACTSQVTRLCDFLSDSNSVTSVAWNERGNYVAVGTHRGYVQIWDVTTSKLITKLTGHTARVGALAWNGETLCSGSRDRLIFQRDIRSNPNVPDRQLFGHRQEVCGLKWSPGNQYLASGGNDNRLYVWNSCSIVPIQTYADHVAAVKAIAWSPHQHGLLASGGGTADRCIRFWNTLTGQAMQCVDTGSQVCNLAWSKHSSELVSTHGYSQNQILVWKYPSLTQVAKLTGHSYRVLYLAMSPDGESIVTGAGDETLRFWNVFSKARSQKECRGNLNLFSHIR